MNEFLMHREMVCKLLGACLVLMAGVGCGMAYSRNQRMRLEQLRQLQQLMLLLQGEIQYQCSILPEAFLTCGNQVSSICGRWLADTGKRLNNMEGIPFQTIWEQQLQALQKETALNAANIEDLRRLGNQLSYPDKETQLGAIQLYCQRIKQQEEHLTGELPGKMKLGTALGILSSVFLIILLI